MLDMGNFDGLNQLINSKGISSKKEIDNSLVNKCVLDSIIKQFNQIKFDRNSGGSVEEVEAAKMNQVNSYIGFSQQSTVFLKILTENSLDFEFREKCKCELELLQMTKELVLAGFLVWYIPFVGIREAFNNQGVLRLILQTQGLNELLDTNE